MLLEATLMKLSGQIIKKKDVKVGEATASGRGWVGTEREAEELR